MGAIHSKTWTRILMGVLAVFVGLNFIIWNLFTKDMLTFEPWYNGGLDRMGYIVGSKHYRKPENTLPRRHIEGPEYRGQHVDVVTVGDSFSNDRLNGRDPLYQDWIASRYDLSVLNLQPLSGTNKCSTLVTLLNSGFFDTMRPQAVILESVERYCITECSQPLNLSLAKPLEELEAYYRTADYRFNPPSVMFLNEGNFKFLMNSVLYRFSDHAYFSHVCVRDLTMPFFSVKNPNRLLFIDEDVKNIPLATPESVHLLNENLNALARRFRTKGIRLYFMPAADKYNMYSAYVVNNPYPKSTFFELLRAERKEYVLVDTKALLEDTIKAGEKDVYYADDTHWSWKAVQKIAEGIHF